MTVTRAVRSMALSASFALPSVLWAGAPKPQAAPAHWVASWTASAMTVENKHTLEADSTVRNVVHLSVGGAAFRVILTNEYGVEPLVIGGASAALSAGADAILPANSHPLLFHGKPSLVIPAGAVMVSDPIEMSVKPFADVAISLFVPGQKLHTLTGHSISLTANFEAPGNQIDAPSLSQATKVRPWRFVRAVDVLAAADAATIVAFGDSISEGFSSAEGMNHRWPNRLAERLAARPETARFAVADEAISGNRVLHDDTGPAALRRFDADVLAVSGLKYLIILESINDIGHMTSHPESTERPVTAEDLINGLNQMIERAHAHGIRVYGATLTPFEGVHSYSASGEAIRQQINEFIRHGGRFDDVIDFDKLVADPSHPTRILPEWDKDHIHPNDAGYMKMGDAVELKLFR